MRIALVLSLLIAVLAVVFALQNPGYINVNLGPFNVRGSTALILMITFCMGVLVGILATLPTLMRRRKRIRHLERHTPGVQTEDSTTSTGSDVGASGETRSVDH